MLSDKEYTKPICWHLPARIDGSSAEDMQRHIDNVARLDKGAQLVLDLRALALFDFHGAGLLLDLIARAKEKNIGIVLHAKNEFLAAMLHFMQFDLLADITMREGEN